MGSSFDRWYSSVIIVLLVIGTTVLAVMMFFIMTDVLLRYIFNSPILGSYEIVEYMMALLIPFGVVYCAHTKGHVAVDILFDRFPKGIVSGNPHPGPDVAGQTGDYQCL